MDFFIVPVIKMRIFFLILTFNRDKKMNTIIICHDIGKIFSILFKINYVLTEFKERNERFRKLE